MIPQNFNNFLFNYSRNCKIEQEYINKPAHQESAFAGVLTGVKKELMDAIAASQDAKNAKKLDDAIDDFKNKLDELDATTPMTEAGA